jgi:hypothetical protein
MMRAWVVVVVTCSAMSGYILLHLHTCRETDRQIDNDESMTRKKKGSKGSVPFRGWMDGWMDVNRSSKTKSRAIQPWRKACRSGPETTYIHTHVHPSDLTTSERNADWTGLTLRSRCRTCSRSRTRSCLRSTTSSLSLSRPRKQEHG